MTLTTSPTRLRTGVPGLDDDVLEGGLPRNRLYLIEGGSGVGKTTLALQFLREGLLAGERVLYISLSESGEELRAAARSHAWDLDGLEIHEMGQDGVGGRERAENTLYAPEEIELVEQMTELQARIDGLHPHRIVLDSCNELRLLAQSSRRFRRQILALKHDLAGRACTMLLIGDPVHGCDGLLHSMSHGIIVLEQLAAPNGAARRRLRVNKLREVPFRAGYHDMVIRPGGLLVFPRPGPMRDRTRAAPEPVSSGVAEIEALAGGGFPRGTSTLVIGPAGVGKSALLSQYAVAAAHRGEKVALFSFDEGELTLFARAASLGMDLDGQVRAGRIVVYAMSAAELSPGELAWAIRMAVERDGIRLVLIDSLNGLRLSVADGEPLASRVHDLLAYIRSRGVLVIMALAQRGLTGDSYRGLDVVHLADNVLLFHYFEAGGRVRRAISVMKKRSGAHEHGIREFTLGARGFTVGAPLRGARGVLAGEPVFEGGGDDPGLLPEEGIETVT